MKIVIVGHVDHGKSTLIGRLFSDTNSLPEGKLEKIKADCRRRGMDFEWSFLMDSLQSERNQGITIDTAQIWFKTKKRNYVIIDAPGHAEFLKNMISGAASADAAIVIIDICEGIKDSSKKHALLLKILGVKQIVVAVNKMDNINYCQKKFDKIKQEYSKYLKSLGLKSSYFIPISAKNGDFVANKTKNLEWFSGPTILEALDSFAQPELLEKMDLRFPVQDVYKFNDKRIIVGRIESGTIKVGDELRFLPSSKFGVVKSIEIFGEKNVNKAVAGMSIGITLQDQIFVERGEVITLRKSSDIPASSSIFEAKIFWLSDSPLSYDKKYKIKINTSEYDLRLRNIKKIIDTQSLEAIEEKSIKRNQIAEVSFSIRGIAVFDDFRTHAKTSRFVIVDQFDIVGGGIIDLSGSKNTIAKSSEVKSKNLGIEDSFISYQDRVKRNAQKGCILWFTGLSASGKSTIAMNLEKKLFMDGRLVYVLDGDNIRNGLCSDIGFSKKDRSENLRRVAEVAKLFADAGFIVIVAFISPYAKDRFIAKTITKDFFHEIYIKAPISLCKKRDPKGLYKKAQKGEIKNFTGIGDVYEEPLSPDLIIDTSKIDIECSVEEVVKYIKNIQEGK